MSDEEKLLKHDDTSSDTMAVLDYAAWKTAYYMKHSQLLNQLCWRMAQVLGRVAEGETVVNEDPTEMLEELIKQRDYYLVVVNNSGIAEVDKR